MNWKAKISLRSCSQTTFDTHTAYAGEALDADAWRRNSKKNKKKMKNGHHATKLKLKVGSNQKRDHAANKAQTQKTKSKFEILFGLVGFTEHEASWADSDEAALV